MHHIFLLYKFSLEPKEPVTPLTLYCKPLDPPAWFIRSKTLACTEHESRGLLCSRAAAAHAQEVTACHRRGWKAVRTKEHALGKGLTLPAKPLGTFFAQLTMKKNLSSKRRDFEQELIWSPNGIKFLPVLCTGETSTYSSQPCQVELFATASTNYQLTKVFSLCIFLPYFSLTSIYTGETIRAFISWFADGKAAAQRRLVNTGHRYSHWGHRGTVLSVNRNAVASLPWAFIPCQQDPGFIKGLKSKNRNIRVWSCPTPIQALNWGFQVGNPTANSVESSERHLWKLFGSRWAELLSGSVSLFLLWATLLPDQLLQVSCLWQSRKIPWQDAYGGSHPTASCPFSYEFTGTVQSPSDARSASAQRCSQGSGILGHPLNLSPPTSLPQHTDNNLLLPAIRAPAASTAAPWGSGCRLLCVMGHSPVQSSCAPMP